MNGPSLSQTQQQRMQLSLAPQMRQSLELLQVPVLELRTLVQQEMEVNPTLEELSPDAEAPETAETEGDGAEENAEAEEAFDEFEMIAQLDDEWKEYYTQTQSPVSRFDPDRHQFALDSLSVSDSLQQHLMNQLTMADLGGDERHLAELIVGSVDDDGYLTSTPEELAMSTGENPEKLQEMLELVQEFDPIGVAARDLSECLFLQLKRLGRGESLAATMVQRHLDLLAGHKYAEIARATGASVTDVEKEARLIGTLDPKPGRRFAAESPHYVLPEVTVIRNDEGEYLVVMNNDNLPHLHVSEHYRQLMHDGETAKEVKQYIRDKVRSSLFLIKSINQRQQTIYNIAREIVRVQKDFLDNGVTHLRPLTMSEVAGVVGVHETTVSRAISGKYMQTPRGMYEMKYFFTPGFKNADGQSVSNQAIKDAISRMIDEEDLRHPLSDQAIAKQLADTGYHVARRTVAKYREELKILPSHLRKSSGG